MLGSFHPVVQKTNQDMFDLSVLRNLDWILVATIIVLIAIGLVVIYSASYQEARRQHVNYVWRQIIWAGAGIFCFLVACCFEYDKIKKYAYPIYGVMVAVLVALLVLGREQSGVKRWIVLGPISIQPAEFAKLAVIFALAKFLFDARRHRRSILYVLVPLAIVLPPMALIVKQPNLGTAFTLLPVWLGMVFVAGGRIRYLLILFAVGLMAIPALWFPMKVYQKKRVFEFLNVSERKLLLKTLREHEKEKLARILDPRSNKPIEELLDSFGEGWNSEQSKIAVGSGGLYGHGFLSGSQTQLAFLPEAHTDFVFPVLCEEWGFSGSCLTLLLYFVMIVIGLRIACESIDLFSRAMASGIVILLASHVVINVAMTIGLLPIAGLPLPLLSYGGSSMLMSMIGLGLLQSIHTRRHYFRRKGPGMLSVYG